MKMLAFVIVAVVGYMAYQFFVQVHITNYTDCLAKATQQQTTTGQPTCAEDNQILEELRACVATVQKDTNLAALLFEPTGTKQKTESLIETHNERCPDWRVDTVDAALYL